MFDDGIVDVEIPVVLRLRKETLDELTRRAEAAGAELDQFASLAVEMQFDTRSAWDRMGYPEEKRQRMREAGITEEMFDAASRGRAVPDWPKSKEGLALAASRKRNVRIDELPKTQIHPKDLRFLVVDGQYLLTVWQLLTDEQIQKNNDFWRGQTIEAMEGFRTILEQFTDDLLEQAARSGADGQLAPRHPRGTERS